MVNGIGMTMGIERVLGKFGQGNCYQVLPRPPAPIIFRSHSGGPFRAVASFACFMAT